MSVVAGLTVTEPGSRWLIMRALDWSGAPVRVEGVHGRFATGIRIDRILYSSASADVLLQDVVVQPTWFASFWRDRLVVERVAIRALEVRTRPTETRSESPPSLPVLPIAIDIGTFELDSLRVNEVDATWLPALSVAASWGEKSFTLATLHAKASRYTIDGDVSLTVGKALEVDAKLHGQVEGPGEQGAVTYVGAVTLSGPVESLQIVASLDAPWPVAVNGRVEPLKPSPFVALQVHGENIEWQGYRVARVNGRAEGTLDAYAGELDAELSTPYRIAGHLHSRLAGTSSELRIDDASAETNAGSAVGAAALSWGSGLKATYTADLHDANPELWAPALPGHVSARVSGTLENEIVALDIAELAGDLAGRPIGGNAKLRVQSGTLHANEVVLESGALRATGSGRWTSEQSSLSAQFTTDDLSALQPQLQGDVAGAIELDRSASGWSGKAQATSRRIQYAGATLAEVALDASRTPGAVNRAHVSARTGAMGDTTIEGLSIDASGPDKRINTKVQWQAPTGDSELDAVLSFAEGIQAELAPGSHLGLPGGMWQLDSPARISFADERVEATSHCWRMKEGSICVDALSARGTDLESKGAVKGLPVAAFAWLDPMLVDLRGTIDGDWAINRHGDDWRGDAELATTGLRLDPEEGEGDEVELPAIRSRVVLRTTGAHATLLVGEAEAPLLRAEATTHGYSADATIDGRVTVAVTDLTILSSLTQRAAKTAGRIDGVLNFEGSLSSPTMTGEVHLTQGALEWQEPYLDLKKIDVRAVLRGDGNVAITGTARSKDSTLNVRGVFSDVLVSARELHLTLSSDAVDVAMPDMEITVVPELELEWSSTTAQLNGVVRVPKAKIKVARLPEGATAVSRDVIVVGRKEAGVATSQFETDLEVKLGDDVQLSAFGLEARLTGSVRLKQSKEGTLSLFGRIDLARGEYSAYGRSLAIESGRLVFQGPVDDPDVDVRATRKIERPEPEGSITVGVHVHGHATALESTLFSEPPLSESDTLSYLVMGRPLNQTTASEGEDLSGVAMALGLAQATGVVNQIRTRMGLDELGAGTSAAQETTVVAGKQLGTKLYARYSYNTFTRLSALLLRYDLTRKLSLEATAGEAPGMDVIYRVGSD
jgi:translocation and assembly module TamB